MKKCRNKRGSLTILVIYIFLIISIIASCICMFAVLQVSLSKNQIKKIQYRYSMEDDLNKIVYDEDRIDKYISGIIFRIFRRSEVNKMSKFSLVIDKEDVLKESIIKSFFSLERIDDKINIVLYLHLQDDDIKGELKAIGPCISEIYELNDPLMIEDELSEIDRVIFERFMDTMEKKNSDYNYKNIGMSEKLNSDKDLKLKLGPLVPDCTHRYNRHNYIKVLNKNHQLTQYNNHGHFILNLKRNIVKNKSLTIGEIEEEECIISKGVLYIEGDLIIDQDFEFSGIIIVNGGSIIVNTVNKAAPIKPKINGMVLFRGESIERDDLIINYDQNSIYQAGSFLPGFIDIRIDTIKKY